MCFIGLMMDYAIKIMISVAVVAMVKSEAHSPHNSSSISVLTSETEDQDVCPGGHSSIKARSQQDGFEWNEEMQGYILTAYHYGYIATHLLGGRLSEIFGFKKVLGPGVFIAGVMTVLGPLAAEIDVGVFIATRVLAGAASGVVTPAMNVMLVKWFVPDERSFIGGLTYLGLPCGAFIAASLSGVLAETGGWTLIFYFFGGICVSFILPWILLTYSHPEFHPRISETEKKYILDGNSVVQNTKTVTRPVPWLSILLSVPLWAHITMGSGLQWFSYILSAEMPTYLSRILHFNLKESGILSSMPFICRAFSIFIGSYISQWIRLKGYVSRMTAYRIFNSLSGFGSALCLILITVSGCNSTIIVTLMILSFVCAGLYEGGSFINHVDLGSNFSGTLAGIYYTITNSMGIFSPTAVAHIINEEQTLSQWKIVFYVGAVFPAVGTTIYWLFGSVVEQPWNKLPSEPEDCSVNSKKVQVA